MVTPKGPPAVRRISQRHPQRRDRRREAEDGQRHRHSTTLEGYRISPEAVDAIVRGEPSPDGPSDEATLRAAMAVQGYARAFDQVLTLGQRRAPITRAVILDLSEALFRPSVDAGFVEPHELRRWRNRAVGLHG